MTEHTERDGSVPGLEASAAPPGDPQRRDRDEDRGAATGISSVSGVSPGAIGISPLLSRSPTSTPLETDETPGDIPRAALWAMRDRMHSLRIVDHDPSVQTRDRLGTGPSALFVIEDEHEHCMICRLVGGSPDGCVYCLVARVTLYHYEQLAQGDVALTEAYSDARDICLCAVYEDDRTSNVVVVEHYRRPRSIPQEYLPPAPFIEFAEPPEA